MSSGNFQDYISLMFRALIYICTNSSCFLLYQEFITWSMLADHGSYFMTMYKIRKLHVERKENQKRKQTKEKLILTTRTTQS